MAGGLLEGAAIQKERIEETVARLEGIQWIGNTTNTVSTNVYFKVAALRCSSLPKLMVNKRISHLKHTFIWWFGFTAEQIKILCKHICWEWRFKPVFELKKLSAIHQCGRPRWWFRHSVPLPLVWSTLHTPHVCHENFHIFWNTYIRVLKRSLNRKKVIFIQLQESPILPFCLLLPCQKWWDSGMAEAWRAKKMHLRLLTMR